MRCDNEEKELKREREKKGNNFMISGHRIIICVFCVRFSFFVFVNNFKNPDKKFFMMLFQA